MKRKTILTPRQIEFARSARRVNRSWVMIAADLGCDSAAVMRVLVPGYAEMRAQQIREAKGGHSTCNRMVAKSMRAPIEVLIDRDIRAAAPRTTTAFLCGDPPPGYSALDQKNSANAK